jgi:hypothetical protein
VQVGHCQRMKKGGVSASRGMPATVAVESISLPLHQSPNPTNGVNRRACFKQGDANNRRLCGPVIRVPGYRSRGPGSVPGATRVSET